MEVSLVGKDGDGGGDGGGVTRRGGDGHKERKVGQRGRESVGNMLVQKSEEVRVVTPVQGLVESRSICNDGGAAEYTDDGGGDGGGDSSSGWCACSARRSWAKTLAFATSLSVNNPTGNQVFLTMPRAFARPTKNCCCRSPR